MKTIEFLFGGLRCGCCEDIRQSLTFTFMSTFILTLFFLSFTFTFLVGIQHWLVRRQPQEGFHFADLSIAFTFTFVFRLVIYFCLQTCHRQTCYFFTFNFLFSLTLTFFLVLCGGRQREPPLCSLVNCFQFYFCFQTCHLLFILLLF